MEQRSILHSAKITRSHGSLVTLFEVVKSFGAENSTSEEKGKPDSAALAANVAHVLLDPTLPMPLFLACGAALRFAARPDSSASSALTADRITTVLIDALVRPLSRHPLVLATIEMLELAAAQGKRLTATAIASRHNVVASHLSRMISQETGAAFTTWRSGFILKPSLVALNETDEHIKQIACRSLAFNHLAQFDAEFRRFFGVAPSAFRSISRIQFNRVTSDPAD